MADEAKQHSKKHQKWMVELLKEKGGSVSYNELVEVGEKHACDTVGAMLKVLKSKKVISYNGLFLMYPMHKDEIIKLENADYDPMTAD
eukprot:CAMPEP_0204342834 /NCGR_PEP_ID=MMETSP0469-20131031/24445_1 /ASSEMBLY_ACC=CAM_ASM_000384 /TAXON_ID=2969 /ORGANISM="Oxyrrhis marina" /LENGTH=87 /DNA_ID=CAMNT_0051327827 /DNA_START=28 /DNA_END=291 /DNA_ORIENTATION=-